MIIIASKSGQLGNRLFVFGHVVAHAIENGCAVANPSFEEYAPYFQATRADLFTRFPLRRFLPGERSGARRRVGGVIDHLASRVAKYRLRSRLYDAVDIHSEEFCNLNSDEFLSMSRASRWVFLRGYRFRDYAAFTRHADELRRVFTPVSPIGENVTALIHTIRQDCDILIGVHIRRGDYKQHLHGIYFYEDRQYEALMRNAAALFPGRRVAFLVCSNEPVNLPAFAGLRVHAGTGQFVEDMYALARCDYLLGPPSTFTLWASFYGSVPLYPVRDPAAPVTRDSFGLYAGQCDFEDHMRPHIVDLTGRTPEYRLVVEHPG